MQYVYQISYRRWICVTMLCLCVTIDYRLKVPKNQWNRNNQMRWLFVLMNLFYPKAVNIEVSSMSFDNSIISKLLIILANCFPSGSDWLNQVLCMVKNNYQHPFVMVPHYHKTNYIIKAKSNGYPEGPHYTWCKWVQWLYSNSWNFIHKNAWFNGTSCNFYIENCCFC